MRELGAKNSQLRRRLCSMEEENASLVTENKQLITELEAAHLELASSKTKVLVLGSTVGSRSSCVSQMKDEIESLEAEVEAQVQALRDTEKKLQETRADLEMRCRLVDKLKEELTVVRVELEDRTDLEKRAEQQRNDAIIDAERQSSALQGFKEDVADKLKKVLESESKLKEALVRCDKDRESWEKKCSHLEQERDNMRLLMGQLKEDLDKMKTVSEEMDTLRLQVKEASSKSGLLERRLSETEVAKKDLEELRTENRGLQKLNRSQENLLEQSQREVQQTKAELAGLEAIICSLHLREGRGGALCANPCLLPGGSSDQLNLKPGEQYQRLLPVLRVMEQEKSRQAAVACGLQENLSRAQEDTRVLQSDVTQQDQQLRKLHAELQARTSDIAQLEMELKRKSSLLEATEKQLEAKEIAVLHAVKRNTNLEHNLLEKSTSTQEFKNTLEKKTRDLQEALAESQRISTDKSWEQEDKITKLQFSLDQTHAQLAKLENDYSSAQREKQEYLQKADRLQASLSKVTQVCCPTTQTNTIYLAVPLSYCPACPSYSARRPCHVPVLHLHSPFPTLLAILYMPQWPILKFPNGNSSFGHCVTFEEIEMKAIQDQEDLLSLKSQGTQSTTKVRFLESALATCQEELNGCMEQIQGAKNRYDRELETKAKELEALQEEVRNSSNQFQNSNEQVHQLEHRIQKQQSTQQQSASKISELEDSQSQLLKQVSHLQRTLEKEKAKTCKELREMEDRALEAGQLAERREKEALQLSTNVKQLTGDMNRFRGELTEKEQELLKIRRDSDTKACELAKMEKMLQETKGLLDKKSETSAESKPTGTDNMVEDLEERVRCSRRDRRNSLHHTQLLESQMKTVRGELVDTLDHLQELRNVLRRSQQKAEERKAAMDKLAAGLRLGFLYVLCVCVRVCVCENCPARESQNELELTRRELERKQQEVHHTSSRETHDELLQQRSLQLEHLAVTVENYKQDLEQKLILQQGALETSQREAKEKAMQIEFLTERLELIKTQLQLKEDVQQEHLAQSQQLRLCREKLHLTGQSLQEMRSRCESLATQLEESTQFGQETEFQARDLKETLAKVMEQAAQTEVRTQATVSVLRQELDTVKRLHLNELSALQESQVEVLKASECISDTLRCSQDQLTYDLQQTRSCLEDSQGNTAALLAELQARERLLQSTNETLLIKESEVTRLRAKISSRERASELHSMAVRSGLASAGHASAGNTLLPLLGKNDDNGWLSIQVKDKQGDHADQHTTPLFCTVTDFSRVCISAECAQE
ncbi:coiled-coil domain-containing protein 18 [Hypomesus transpacificus]|uniref:coiled-coil domain-containing protein 18 n=1 Tax=Hypomesus transpacificus TaxID=137520 RepID=UPI001F087178|nr:coiled-coil domain-containing protein 18 [Hypomesus transpacificus]